MKKIAHSYSGDSYLTIKLVIEKEERVREEFLALIIERECQERESRHCLLVKERKSRCVVGFSTKKIYSNTKTSSRIHKFKYFMDLTSTARSIVLSTPFCLMCSIKLIIIIFKNTQPSKSSSS